MGKGGREWRGRGREMEEKRNGWMKREKEGRREGEREKIEGRENTLASLYMYCTCTAPHMAALYLELISLDNSTLYVILDLPQDGEHGDVGLAGAGRSRDEQVLTGVVGNIKHD